MRQAIGERTRTSKQEKPDFWLSAEVDATALTEVRAAVRRNEAETVPSYNDYILKCVALALRENPRFNAWTAPDGLHVLDNVNVAFAVATDQGVLMPTLMDADKKPMTQIAEETREMIDLARRGRLRATLQMGAGFSVSNIGPSDIDAFSAIISPPQTGILTIGAIKMRPIVVGDEVVARRTMICTLSVDHAAADGADGAKFLRDVKRNIESRELLESL
jgi:pyruvate dehydrogenase E2 component (dihydrolipoamide acetyltransferase)